jgi:hypothetical protein
VTPAVAEDADPLRDLSTIATELSLRGMDRHPVLLAYCVGFNDLETASAAAAAAARDGWSTASYRWSTRDVVRLSRLGRADTQDLLADRDYIRRFAAARGGRWDSVCLEAVTPDDYWARIADRFIHQPRAPAPLPLPRQRDRQAPVHQRSA